MRSKTKSKQLTDETGEKQKQNKNNIFGDQEWEKKYPTSYKYPIIDWGTNHIGCNRQVQNKYKSSEVE